MTAPPTLRVEAAGVPSAGLWGLGVEEPVVPPADL